LFVVTVGFGLWLSHLGKPYHGIFFNIHKLVALAAVIITILRISNVLKGSALQGLGITSLIVAGVCVLALFASGALMSMGKPAYALTLTIHRITPGILAIALTLVAYLIGKKP
jgi:hypothetical protein